MSNWMEAPTEEGFYFVRAQESDPVEELTAQNFRIDQFRQLVDEDGCCRLTYLPSCRFKKINVTDEEAIA